MSREHNHYFQNTVRVGYTILPQPKNQLHSTSFLSHIPSSSLWNRTLDFLRIENLNYPSHHYNITVTIANIRHRYDAIYVNKMSGYRSENPETIPGKDTFFSVPCNNQNIPIQQFRITASLSQNTRDVKLINHVHLVH
jgi:hypothetical protein